jgi:hypothetical protein
MTLQEIVTRLSLTRLTAERDFSQVELQSGYTSDLLSCVMAGARHHGVWVTLQSHSNIVAVAALLELGAVIITEGTAPDQDTIGKANEEEINLFLIDKPTFWVVGRLWEMGLREG